MVPNRCTHVSEFPVLLCSYIRVEKGHLSVGKSVLRAVNFYEIVKSSLRGVWRFPLNL
jgi:hypothetical protein